jgi:hypothetical protein
VTPSRPDWDPLASVASWAPASILAGASWALWGVRQTFSVERYFALWCGAALSIWLVLVALTELARDRRLVQASLPSAGVTLLLLTQLGRWLLDATHHRPLGAVTFSCLGLLVWSSCFVLFWRRRVPLAVGALLALGALAWVGVLLLPLGAVLLEPLFGLVIVSGLFALGPRVRTSSRALSVGCTGSLWSAAVIAGWLAPKVGGSPFILGLPGILS